MAEVLVLVDHADGAVRKPTTELLTIARRLGEPSAVFLGKGADDALETLGRFGAAKVYVVDADRRLTGLLPLNRLVLVAPARPVEEIADPVEVTVPPTLEDVFLLLTGRSLDE